ncbi:Heat shock protein HSP 90-beta [Microtus ochrogaster]|uniref:Heat shock protein HSP 90-beta n=1 Tax=Microtus ochrogaster TaxID=79684 RepID=A0A8J6GIU7_MICOH|nr:Heat shock protein HSP 90-beta [Microtus ochrogaster]
MSQYWNTSGRSLIISQEVFQQSKILRVIIKIMVKKSCELFSELAEDKESTRNSMAFSKILKFEICEDSYGISSELMTSRQSVCLA